MLKRAAGGIVLTDQEYRRICDLVPPEFLEAWDWFDSKTNCQIPRLPFGKGKPEGLPMPLARQSAIYCPSYPSLPSKGKGKKRYALSVYSVGQAVYPDGNASIDSDGSWALQYHEQRGNDPHQDYNALLFACMNDGVPLGVMVKAPSGGYTVMGLAYVDAYNASTHMFSLRGPVRLPDESQVYARSSREWKAFEKLLFDAYEGACAITDVDLPEVLECSLIDERRGEESLVVNNGLLLRVGISRLYEHELLAIRPGSLVVETSNRLSGTGYARLNGCSLRPPRKSEFMPDGQLLERRYSRFISRK